MPTLLPQDLSDVLLNTSAGRKITLASLRSVLEPLGAVVTDKPSFTYDHGTRVEVEVGGGRISFDLHSPKGCMSKLPLGTWNRVSREHPDFSGTFRLWAGGSTDGPGHKATVWGETLAQFADRLVFTAQLLAQGKAWHREAA